MNTKTRAACRCILLAMLEHPWAFTLRALKAFRANQGLLLAGAVAYYALLSVIPLLILVLIVFGRPGGFADLPVMHPSFGELAGQVEP